MSAHPPPVPPANRSDKGPHSANPAAQPKDTGKAAAKAVPGNLDEQGRQGNLHQNTTHPGLQQDR